jgi:enoyl reductase-like protein
MSKLSELAEDVGQLHGEFMYIQHTLSTLDAEVRVVLKRRDEITEALATAQNAYLEERERGDRHAS